MNKFLSPPIATRNEQLSEYSFAVLLRQLKKVEQESKQKVLNLSVGEPSFPPSITYMTELAKLSTDPLNFRYPGYDASDEFSSALEHWYKNRYSVTLSSNELLPLNGAKDGITHLPLALLNAKDEILIPTPGYPSFYRSALLVGAKPIYYRLNPKDAYKLNLTSIENSLTPEVKYIWVNFPSNPTGQVFSLEELHELVSFARLHGLFILYDNAYSEITFNGFKAPSILSIEGAKDVAIEIGSFSKTYSFAGLRLGWIAGNPEIVSALRKIKSQYDSGISLILQKTAAFALLHPDTEWNKAMLNYYDTNRKQILKLLTSLGMSADLPTGSLYIWAKLPQNSPDADTYCLNLLEDRHILLTPGSAFGPNNDRYVRVSITADLKGMKSYM